MLETLVTFALVVLGLYLAAGIVAAVPLHLRGLKQLDPGVEGAGWFFRVLITPGLVALWPWLVARWRSAGEHGAPPVDPDQPLRSRELRRFHYGLARALAVLLPVLVGAAVLLRPPEAPIDPGARAGRQQPEPLPEIVGTVDGAFADVPLSVSLRRAPGGRHQVETRLDDEPGVTLLVLYWNPGGADAPMRDTVFLGSVWGPALQRFDLPARADLARGGLVLYSLAERKRLGAIAGRRLLESKSRGAGEGG